MADGWQLTIFTDHRPLSSPTKYLDREIRKLECVVQLISDIRFLVGKDNIVADALSQLEIYVIADVPTLDFEAMTAAQENYIELHNIRFSGSALKLQKTPLFYCEMYSQGRHILCPRVISSTHL